MLCGKSGGACPGTVPVWAIAGRFDGRSSPPTDIQWRKGESAIAP